MICLKEWLYSKNHRYIITLRCCVDGPVSCPLGIGQGSRHNNNEFGGMKNEDNRIQAFPGSDSGTLHTAGQYAGIRSKR